MKKLGLLVLSGLFLMSAFNFQAQAQSKKINSRYTGPITKTNFLNSDYTNRWFTPRYKRYNPNAAAMKIIKKNIDDYKIVMFMANWCPDSHREVPRLYKILEETNYDLANLKVYAVDYRMHTAKDYEKGYNIHAVPTIIFYQDGKEANRFVEHAQESLAKDIAKIVSGQSYKPRS